MQFVESLRVFQLARRPDGECGRCLTIGVTECARPIVIEVQHAQFFGTRGKRDALKAVDANIDQQMARVFGEKWMLLRVANVADVNPSSFENGIRRLVLAGRTLRELVPAAFRDASPVGE